MKTELVIFDMDGLMFDTERVYYRAWQEAAKAYGYTIDWEIYTQIVARNSRYIEKVLKKLLGDKIPFEDITLKKRALADKIIEEEGLFKKKGLDELLIYLEDHAIKKAVATSSMREKALRYLEKAKLHNRFDYIICGDEVHESKPNPEIFEKVAKKLLVTNNQCLVLEDSRLGIKAAKAAEMRRLFVPDLVIPDEEIVSEASGVVESLLDVILWLKEEDTL